MKKDTTADRLRKIMQIKKLRQIDVLNRTKPYCAKFEVKMNKSDISQYVSGKVEPSQEKLVVLGMALNVQEAWLMGLDVPMERKGNAHRTEKDTEILNKLSLLSERDKTIILKMIDLMLKDI